MRDALFNLLDGSPWPRSRVLDDRQYVYQATSNVNGRTADKVIELQDPYWGRVRLERWNGLHEKRGADVPYDVIRASEAGDRWTELTALACWLLFLARPTVEDTPLPWQRSQQRLTPQRVQHSIYPIFVQIGSPARLPKRRGNAPGWPQGVQRTPKQ